MNECEHEFWRLPTGKLCRLCKKFWPSRGQELRPSYREPNTKAKGLTPMDKLERFLGELDMEETEKLFNMTIRELPEEDVCRLVTEWSKENRMRLELIAHLEEE